MPLNNSTNISFSSGNFTSSAPIGGQDALTGFGINNSANYRWANKTAQLNLGNTNYGYVTFDISYTVTGTADVVGISFAGPNMPVSYSTTLSGLFTPLLNGTYIKLQAGVTTRIYAIVNATKKSSQLPITLTVGRKGTLPSNVTVNVQYNCTDVGPLYSYLCGLHVYSPYDAANSPKLKTYLYSYTPIGSWTTDTELYANPHFSQPAYPYYYSYGTNVYKVGDEFERSFGEKRYIYVEKKWALGKTRVYNKVEGPKSWRGLDVDGFTTENFVYPTMNNVGKLRQILTTASLNQPSSYRYYLGAGPNAQAAANFFTQFDFNNRQVHTITGFVHALQKLSSGFASGYFKNLKYDYTKFAVTVASIGLAYLDSIFGYTIAQTGAVNQFLLLLARIDVWINSTSVASAGTGPVLGSILGPFAISLINIFIIAAALYAIYLLLQSTKITIEEPSVLLRYRYANTPYLNNGTTLYTNTGLTTSKAEYYCDGIYFYDHLDQVILNKELSYSTNALLSLDPLKKGLAYSVAVDVPDSGSVILDFNKLLALSYCSGKPDTIGGTNQNIAQSVSFTPLNLGGDLLTYPASITVSIPEGTITTTGSQAVADAEALQYLNQLTASYVSGSYGTPKTGSASFGAYFTHEIKVENTPNTGSVFFDNTNGAGLTVGKYLYYDIGGFQKVFNGYYAADSGSVPPYSNYKTFFKTVNGAVTDILAMASSGATTVTSVVNSATYPVQTSNQNYTSDWYWYQPSYNELSNDITYITDINTNPNSLYTTSSLKSGFLLPNTSSFYTYDSISSTASYSEATAGFYYAFTSYESGYMFAYSTATTISINLTEVCFTDYAVGEPYGVNISGATGSASSSLYYPVNLTLNAYNGGSLLASFPATASAEGVTYVDFPSPITKDSNVTNVTMTIDSVNPNNKILYVTGSFTNCNPTTPSPTTAAPTTAAPTTAAPTTAAPTPNPTTAAPTPNPTAPFSAIVSYSNISAQEACNNPQGSFSMTGNNGTFCSSSAFTATNWTSLPQTTYWLAYNGQVIPVYHPANSNTVTITGPCSVCPTPSPTTAPTTAAPTTAAPTTAAPTTAAPTTPSPTVLVTQLTGFVSLVDGATACGGGEYGSVRIDVQGTTICDATSIVYLPASVWSDMINNQDFYVSNKVGATFKSRKFRRNGTNFTAAPILACEDCPTPSPTTSPTTAAPTTAPTTAAPTPNPTTAAPTPNPTAPFSAIVSYSTISANDACNNPQGSFSMTGNNGTFCLSSAYTATNWTSLAQNTYWLAYGGQVRQVYHPAGSNTVTTTNACAACPTPSPTAAPTTAAPTPNPTPNPTAAPTTAAPTPNPTPNPTAAAPAFSFLVNNLGRASAGLACITSRTRTIYSYDSDFSTASRFYSTNTYPYTPFDGGSAWFSDGIYAVQINSSGYPMDTFVCPTPSPTTAPTTAAPTNPPTPPPTNPPTTPPTPPPTNPPTPPPTPPPTTPPTPPPTNPPTPPPTNPPTPPPTIAYYYYEVTPCFSGGNLIARSLTPELTGVYAANGTCYIIQGIAVPQAYDFDIDAANYQGGSCYVTGCGYIPPTPAPVPADTYVCDPFIGCYQDPFGDPYNVVCLNCNQV